MEKILYLLRGAPGAGKSTLAGTLGAVMYEADSFFYVAKDPATGKILNRHQYDGEYEFDMSLIKQAHKECKDRVEDAMSWGQSKISVANTFTQEWEMKDYYVLAEKYGYKVFSLIVENRHGGENVHNVPNEVIEKMKGRFQVKL